MFKKIKKVIIDELSKGLSPEKLAQSLVVGILIGCFPLLGFTTLLALIAGHFFRLNHAVLQSVNYLMYPIQILLIPIYIKFISTIFSLKDIPIRPDVIVRLFIEDPKKFLDKFSLIALGEVVVWMLISLCSYFILMRYLIPVVLKIKENSNE